MPEKVAFRPHLPLVPLLAGAAVVILAAAVLIVLGRPHGGSNTSAAAPSEARAYLSNLALSDVSMKASENFMKQQVVEVQGKLTNNGPRPLKSVEVFCVFDGIDGHEIYRERASVISTKIAPVRSGETRPFRLPFDALPDGWNQAMPKLVIASIAFGN